MTTCTCGALRFPAVRLAARRKLITQSPDNIDQLEIFGQQDYIQTSKPESMSCKANFTAGPIGNRQNMKVKAGCDHVQHY